MKIIRRLYDWSISLAAHPKAEWALAGITFIESSVFPIPPDVTMIPMCLADRKKSFRYATICTVFSVLGGLLGYAIGYFFYESFGKAIVEFYGKGMEFDHVKKTFDERGGWILVAKGMTPFPYKILTIMSGVLHLSLPVFIIGSIVGRAIRFYLVAALIWKYGEPIRTFIEKYLNWLCLLFLILLIGGFYSLKYMV
jgi:membrane protein YqaA with SNARE-associated domain